MGYHNNSSLDKDGTYRHGEVRAHIKEISRKKEHHCDRLAIGNEEVKHFNMNQRVNKLQKKRDYYNYR